MKGQGLECVIPDFSRTYHYGISGTHMNRNFHNNYFIHHRFNTIPDVKLKNVDKLKKNLYELELFKEFKKAKFLSKGDPCEVGYENFVPNTKGETYVIWFAEDPIYQPQQNLLRCWGMMDDYLRCLHNGILFFYIKDNFIMVVSENSNYAKKFKTENIPAVHITKAHPFFLLNGAESLGKLCLPRLN
ncbi:protein O-linked-mannose beta-1,2-N-acetylglucosaminyltransferase 1-like [Zophobas morio]|uniref:protein O-linked-mannose beta-1,2-N-acetylglucosaminyltransferase 1-like n=1 Tax=Zophobas morio TaxID=2755281 RepID=UPI003082752F